MRNGEWNATRLFSLVARMGGRSIGTVARSTFPWHRFAWPGPGSRIWDQKWYARLFEGFVGRRTRLFLSLEQVERSRSPRVKTRIGQVYLNGVIIISSHYSRLRFLRLLAFRPGEDTYRSSRLPVYSLGPFRPPRRGTLAFCEIILEDGIW